MESLALKANVVLAGGRANAGHRALDATVQLETNLNVFKADPNYEQNEKEYEVCDNASLV